MKRIAWAASVVCWMLWLSPAQALTTAQVQGMVMGETDARIAMLQKSLAQADAQTAVFLQALADDAVMVAGDKVVLVRDGQALDPVSNAEINMPDNAESVVSNNRMRGEVDAALAALQLLSPDDALRMKAAQALVSEPDASKLPLLDKALAIEKNEAIAKLLRLAYAAIEIANPDTAKRLQAARDLAQSKTPNTQLLLNQQLSLETDPQVKAQLIASLADIKAALA
jgi:urea transport system permease protein